MTPEIDRLRADERFKEVGNRVADAIIYDIMLCDPINNQDRVRWILAAVERFGGELPLTTISSIVDRVIVNELGDRARATALRKRKPAKRALRIGGSYVSA